MHGCLPVRARCFEGSLAANQALEIVDFTAGSGVVELTNTRDTGGPIIHYVLNAFDNKMHNTVSFTGFTIKTIDTVEVEVGW